MSLQVLVTSTPVKHSHYHHCPFCKKHVFETNVICKKEMDHVYYCANHLQYFREELGFIDALVDEVVHREEAAVRQQRRSEAGAVDPLAESLLTRQEAYTFQQEWTMDEEPTVLYDQYGYAHRVHSPR